MREQGKTNEEIARVISPMRNQIRLAEAKDDVELQQIKTYNLNTYGQEEGPTPDQMLTKYGTWDMVITKSFSVNSGADACVGLYDTYYDLYIAVGIIEG